MPFRFKQFTVDDERSSMKVGTDAVLLGAWAGKGNPSYILDIGSGSGVISLMLAQRFPGATVSAIDIHPGSVKEAKKNFDESPWKKYISVSLISLQEFTRTEVSKYDLIVSNPPYFIDSLLPPNGNKKLAKHTGSLSYAELVSGISSLLQPDGIFALILPYENSRIFEKHAVQNNLHLIRELLIKPVAGKAPNRILQEWSDKHQPSVSKELTIRKTGGEYTDEYKKLTREFYLAL